MAALESHRFYLWMPLGVVFVAACVDVFVSLDVSVCIDADSSDSHRLERPEAVAKYICMLLLPKVGFTESQCVKLLEGGG